MNKLTQDRLSEIRKLVESNTYEGETQVEGGIYIEPYYIDCDERRFVIYQRETVSEYWGNNCWEYLDEQAHYGETYEFKTLDNVLDILKPDITDEVRQSIHRMVKSSEYDDCDYYGNGKDYVTKWVSLDDVCDVLGIEREYVNLL